MKAFRTAAAGLMLVLGTAACVPSSPPYAGDPGPVSGGGVNACGALDLQYLVGAPARDLEAIQFNKPVRVIYPGSAVTMDFNPERLNFEVDRAGRVARVTCG
ncbi:I78 family peptidase inhibitor [Tabrizicola sp. TH137]|uniref:I78 family peptidase inhibitor n=1 Tax=Tabrizicola sp. TH137 TaxID=2067452 RepID=UPI0020B30087|nr:I78 family peptidase inhibitor [Tabrizicola sp. TH137]